MISFIAAIGKNRELGFGNKLPWYLPDDLKRFKDITKGHTVIMGQKTFESIGRPLPKRRNIVGTKDPNFRATGVEISTDLEKVLAESHDASEEIFVIGGGIVFKIALPYASKIYLTHVDVELPADSFFPEFDPLEWKIISEEFHPKDEKHLYDFTFKIYEKK